jgi:hypothetical protein
LYNHKNTIITKTSIKFVNRLIAQLNNSYKWQSSSDSSTALISSSIK